MIYCWDESLVNELRSFTAILTLEFVGSSSLQVIKLWDVRYVDVKCVNDRSIYAIFLLPLGATYISTQNEQTHKYLSIYLFGVNKQEDS